KRWPSARAMAAAVYESRPPLNSTTASDTARVWAPDVLVQLQLHANRQVIGEHPFRQCLRIEHAVDRREMNRRRPIGEVARADDITRPLVVGAILDDELHFVSRAQPIQIRPIVRARFTTARTFDVKDRDDLAWDA